MRLVLFVLAIGVVALTSVFNMIASSQPHWIEQSIDAPAPITKLRIVYGLFEKCDQSIFDPDVWTCRKFPMNEEDCKDPSGLAMPPPFLSNNLAEQDESMASVARQQQEVAQLTSEEDLPYSRPLIRDVIRDTLPFSLFLSSSSRSNSFCNYWRLAGYLSQMSIAFGGASIFCLLLVLGGGRRKRRTAWPLCASLVVLHAVFQLALWAIVLSAYRSQSRFSPSSTHLGYSFGFSTAAWLLDALLVGVMIVTGLYGEWEIPEKERQGLIPSHSYGTLPGSDDQVERR